MASDDEGMSGSMKALIGLGLLICIAGFKAWQEFRFATAGQQGIGTITKITEHHDRRGGSTGYNVYFDFSHPAMSKPAHSHIRVDAADVDRYAVGQEIPIDYYGETFPTTRLQGTSNRLWVYFFFGSVALLIGVVAYMSIKSAREDSRPRQRKR
jgi:hypothetical protein